jgi:carboxymethylenebutenolidase
MWRGCRDIDLVEDIMRTFRFSLLAIVVFSFAGCATTSQPVVEATAPTTTQATDSHADHAHGPDMTGATANRLESSPRHAEWVDVKQGNRTVRTFVVYPQRTDRAMTVLLIHENRGLNDWVRTVADRIAEAGYIAVAPDLLSGMAPNGGGTRDFASEDAAREAIGRVPSEQAMADVGAVLRYARALPAANGKAVVAGFCWGGARAWETAVANSDLAAAFVFYGTPPQDATSLSRVMAPVYGFYGGDDARVNATIPQTQEQMKALGKRYEPVIYEGAGHAFMRLGEVPDATPANKSAHDRAWERWLALLADAAR